VPPLATYTTTQSRGISLSVLAKHTTSELSDLSLQNPINTGRQAVKTKF